MSEPRTPLHRILRGVHMTMYGSTPAHADLRNRIAGLTLLSLVLDLVAACAGYALEHGHGEVTTFGNALFWTTTQMLTVSSQFPNPLTAGGKVLDVAMELYALTVVTSLAGVFSSFFHHRARDRARDAAKAAPPDSLR